MSEDYSLVDVVSEFELGVDGDASTYGGAIVTLADGSFVTVWNERLADNNNHVVIAQRYDSQGTAIGSPIEVCSENRGSQSGASVAELSDGGFVVTWSNFANSGATTGIYGQVFDSSGNKVGTDFQVHTEAGSEEHSVVVTGLEGGGFVAVWESDTQDAGTAGVYAQMFAADGTRQGTEFRVNTYSRNDQIEPAVSALGDGGFIVTWTSYGQDPIGASVHGQRYDSDGAPVGNEFRANTYIHLDQTDTAVAGLADGGFVITWQCELRDRGYDGIVAKRFDRDGNVVTQEFVVNTTTEARQTNPQVTALQDGGFVITWQDENGLDGDGDGIFAQRYASDGSKVGGEVQINSATAGDQSYAQVAEMANGDLLFAWRKWEGPPTYHNSTFAKVVAYNASPTGEVAISGSAAEGQTLTASNTLTDADGLGTIAYQWQRDGVDISGATGSSYTLSQDDVGAEITVTASYVDDHGTTEAVTSAATAAVTNVNDEPTGSVTIVGTAAEDQTLTASDTLADEDGLGTITYQWQRDGVDISGATGTTFTLTQDDVGAEITVTASYVDDHGTTEAVTSAATAAVTKSNDAPTGSVTISGTAAEEQTLTASNTLADEDGLGTITYQWQRDGVDITGATGTTYTLSQDDVGAEITVTASYVDDHGTTEAVTSAATAAVTNVNDAPTGSVTISGTAAEDQTLTASNTLADEDGLGTITYQWQRDGADISGATGTTFTLTQDDVGAEITVTASYVDDHGTTEAVTSAATAAVTNANDAPTGSVTIVGTAAEDQTLTASDTLADEDGLGTITYQWQRDGVDISGATGSSYTLSQDDVGAEITVTASYVDDQGTTEAVTSAATAAVTNVNDEPTGNVTISGTAAEDQTLTASNTLADEDGLGTITYQWQRDGVDISGAIGNTYTLTQDDVGATITVSASYIDDQDTVESVTSTPTSKVRHGDIHQIGTASDDEILGQNGDDVLVGGGGGDNIIGGWGHDTLKGNTGSDNLRGWGGEDQLFGGHDNDLLFGGKGNDTLKGGAGDDQISGRRDEDVVLGGHGQDMLKGGQGDDLLSGGIGADIFVFGRNHGNDTITDFELGSDLIHITSGAKSLEQITFSQDGSNVLLSFAATTVLVESTTVAVLNDADHFLFT